MSASGDLTPTVRTFWKQLETNGTKRASALELLVSGVLFLVSKPALRGPVTRNPPPPTLYSRTII